MKIFLNPTHTKNLIYNNYKNFGISDKNQKSINKNSDLNFAYDKRDLVTFSGRAQLISKNMKYAPSGALCIKVNNNAQPAKAYLDIVLDKYIKPLEYNKTRNKKAPKYPVSRIQTRIKSPTSIREKVVSKYSKLHGEEVKKFSEQIYEEFSQYCNVNPSVDKSVIISKIEEIIEKNILNKKSPVYESSAFFLLKIYDEIKNKNYFDFSSKTEKYIKTMMSDIADSLETSFLENDAEENTFNSPDSVEGIKYYANDIVGARILLKNTGQESVGLLINALKQAVSDKKLKILSIESNIPDPDRLPKGRQISEYIYATDAQLRSLAKASGAKLIKNNSKSGYLAVHINVDLSNSLFGDENSPYNGYKGEIQIIGEDVEKLKEVEDICYKLKDNKNAINAAYKPFKDYFMKYYNNSNKDAFDDYTYMLYLSQRTIPDDAPESQAFETIEQLGFKDKVPKELDFNILRKIKLQCDNEIKKQEQLEMSKITYNAKSSKNLDEIKDILSYISYYLK